MKTDSKLKAAMIYAQALYECSDNAEDINACYENATSLRAVLPDCMEGFNLLNNPLWNTQQKYEVVDAIGKKLKLHPHIINTLKVLVQHRKINLLPEVIRQFISVYNDKHDIAEIEVTSVIPLTGEQDTLLKKKLASIFAKKVIINYSTDSQIIGGLVIKYGTHLIDASVRSKLNALENFMKGNQ